MCQVQKMKWVRPEDNPTLTQVDRWHLEHVAKQKWDGVIGDG